MVLRVDLRTSGGAEATGARGAGRLLVRRAGRLHPSGSEPGFQALVTAHPALRIRDLASAREALVAAGVAIEEDDTGLPVRRFYVRDPFGNRIELDDARDGGFSER